GDDHGDALRVERHLLRPQASRDAVNEALRDRQRCCAPGLVQPYRLSIGCGHCVHAHALECEDALESLVTGAVEPIARTRRLPNNLAVLMLLLAIAAPLYGIVYDINGVTQAGADVGVTVQVRALDHLKISLPDHAITTAQVEGVAGHETQ